MRSFLLSILLFFPIAVFAQHLEGKVIDKQSGLPVVYATVSTSNNNTVITSYYGLFTLNNIKHADTIRVSCVGYRGFKVAYKDVHTDTLFVYLNQSSIMLHDVNVKARHNFKQDSINLRKQFNNVFNYKGTSFKDIFTTVDPYEYHYNTYNMSENNATMIVNVNLLSVVDLLTKKKAPETKLQQTLIQDEANNYVDQRFCKQKITGLTGMKGDSLANFIMMYRPGIDQAKKMNDYQMVMYIKNSYTEFLKNYDPKKSLFGQ
jgi:hypothetical protein